MAKWSGKSRGGTAGYRFFILILKYTHIKVAYFFLAFTALYFLIFSDKQSLQFYFRKVLHYGKLKTLISIYKNYFIFGQVLLDKVFMLSGNKNAYTFDFEGEHHLRELAEGGTGGLLIGAHMGNWEVAGQLLERLNTRINIVMLDAEHERIKDMLDDVIDSSINVIPIKDDFSHLFKITEAFQNKEIVAMHGDRFLPGTNTVGIDFLGYQAQFPAGPLYLASKNKVPVSFVFTMKESSTHYHFYATEGEVFPYPARLKTRKEEIRNMVGAYVGQLEKILKKYPLQWFNYFPFWDEEQT